MSSEQEIADFYNPAKLPSYYVLVVAKDERLYIRRTVESIFKQTHPPAKVILHDDGSTDGTYKIMQEFQSLYPELVEVKETGNKDRDFAHVPKMYNENWLKGYDFILILGGDIELEPEYVEKCLRLLKYATYYVVASGDYEPYVALLPHGAGRFIRMSWFWEVFKEGRCSESIAHESEFLDRAAMTGKASLLIREAHFNHLKPLGTDHGFFEFGHASRALGYDWLYMLIVTWRCRKHPHMRTRGALNMLWGYLTFKPTPTGYHSLAAPEIRAYNQKTTRSSFYKTLRDDILEPFCKVGITHKKAKTK